MVSDAASAAAWPACSTEPQLSLITVAPSAAAVFCAMSRPVLWSSLACTTRMLHRGHAALTMSTSSAVSTVQSSLGSADAGGRFVVWPSWFTIRRQPLAIVHAGRP